MNFGKEIRPRVMRRFWAKVDKGSPTDCWGWRSAINVKGYGRFWFKGRAVKAHRFAYLLKKGAIPPGFEIDHTCRNVDCVNPAHLEAVPPDENRRRRNEAT